MLVQPSVLGMILDYESKSINNTEGPFKKPVQGHGRLKSVP